MDPNYGVVTPPPHSVRETYYELSGNLRYKDLFTKLDVDTRGLLEEAFDVLHELKRKDFPKADFTYHEPHMNELIGEIRNNIKQMKLIATDMNMVQTQKNLSPHLKDQAKTISLIVEGLQSHTRKLQMEFQTVVNYNQRDDLFRLSRSPFDEQRPRRRVGKAGEISSGATESLMHSQKVLMETVGRSAGTLEQLAQSSNSIINNNDELMEQNSVIGTSKKLLGKYGRREWTDKVLICLALAFFFACVIYILQKRIF